MSETLGKVLTARMELNRHTFRDAELILGASAGTINRWANDLSTPDATHIPALLTYLNVDMDTLGGFILRSEMARSRTRIQETEGDQ